MSKKKKKKKKVVKSKNLKKKRNVKRNERKRDSKSNVSSKKTNLKKVDNNTKTTIVKKEKIENTVKEDKKKKIKINKAKIRKIFIISFIVLCLSLLVVFYKIMKDKNSSTSIEFEKLTIKEYFELYNSKELQYIYITNKSCLDCKTYESNINKLQAEYKINIKKLDFTNINDENLEKLKLSHSELKNGIKVPMLISIKDGKEVNQVSGIKEYAVLKKFVDNSINPSDSNSFDKISLDKYLSLIKSKDTTLIYIGDSSNNGCKKFSPILESVTSERKVKVHYLNTNIIKKEEDWEKLENSDAIFKKQWFMPTIIVVKNGKIKDYKMETMTKKDLEKFLKKNGL